MKIELSKGVTLCPCKSEAMMNNLFKLIVPERQEIIFSGEKSELYEKGEEFWKGIVSGWEHYKVNYQYTQYLDYTDLSTVETAKESGHSALSLIKERFVVVVREKTKN